MGCDIHFHRLYHVNPEGQEQDFDVLVEGTSWKNTRNFDAVGKFPISEVDLDRNYCAFAILAGVRNDWGYIPLSSVQDDSFYQEWGYVEHTPTRLKISDFVATPEYWARPSKRFEPGDFGEQEHAYATDAGMYYARLLPAIVAECERRGFALEDVYLEFWFDS